MNTETKVALALAGLVFAISGAVWIDWNTKRDLFVAARDGVPQHYCEDAWTAGERDYKPVHAPYRP